MHLLCGIRVRDGVRVSFEPAVASAGHLFGDRCRGPQRTQRKRSIVRLSAADTIASLEFRVLGCDQGIGERVDEPYLFFCHGLTSLALPARSGHPTPNLLGFSS